MQGERRYQLRYSREHSEKTRRAILDSAAIKFRECGQEGAGVGDIASSADVTTGAIYKQFESKDALFTTVVEEAMQRLVAGLQQSKDGGNDEWLAEFVSHYLSSERVELVGLGCGLPVLTPDISRASEDVKAVFNDGLNDTVCVMMENVGERSISEGDALLILASILGSVILARASGKDDIREKLQIAANKLSKLELRPDD
jgi:TetR/AcrR family transcriptional repressor of nem operon